MSYLVDTKPDNAVDMVEKSAKDAQPQFKQQ